MNRLDRALLVLLLLGVSCGLKQNTEACSSNDECNSGCCHPATTVPPWCSAGTECLPDGTSVGGGSGTGGGNGSGGGSGGGSNTSGGGGGTTSNTGACAYFDTRLNRVVCNPTGTASGCQGTFGGVGSSCATMSCTSGSDPYSCTFSGGSSGGGTGSGGGGGGGGGSSLLCGRYTVVDPGSSSTPGSGLVRDANTAFTWTRYGADKRTQANAISYCAGRGMRLPTRAEAQAIAAKCCVQTGTVNDCNAAFPLWQTWTTTSTGTGQAYYVNSGGITCLPSNCVLPVTSTVGVMCLRL